MKNQTLLQFTKRFAALAGAAVLTAVTALGGTANAANTYSSTITGTKTMTFNKYLLLKKDASVPSATFTFAVTAGTAQSYNASNGTAAIFAGVDPASVTMTGVGTGANNFQIAFDSSDTAGALTTLASGDTVTGFTSGTHKYVKKTATLDFSACKFTEPGVYRYLLTESGTNAGITNDSNKTRVIDVYVKDASTSTVMQLAIEGYVMHTNASATIKADTTNGGTASYNSATKSAGFTNTLATGDLTVHSEVSGNQASRSKYFKYTVAITGASAKTAYTVDLSGADATPTVNGTKQTNAASVTTDASGNVTATYYLQHGQHIVIKDLISGTSYNVTVDKEDYQSTAAGATGYTGAVSGTISSDVKTSYLLKRSGAVPTGVIMTVAPFAAATLLGAAGIVGVTRKKKNEDAEV